MRSTLTEGTYYNGCDVPGPFAPGFCPEPQTPFQEIFSVPHATVPTEPVNNEVAVAGIAGLYMLALIFVVLIVALILTPRNKA